MLSVAMGICMLPLVSQHIFELSMAQILEGIYPALMLNPRPGSRNLANFLRGILGIIGSLISIYTCTCYWCATF